MDSPGLLPADQIKLVWGNDSSSGSKTVVVRICCLECCRSPGAPAVELQPDSGHDAACFPAVIVQSALTAPMLAGSADKTPP